MNEGKATIASVMCPVSLKLQFCYSHFTECPASNWWGSISSSLYVTPSWESVGREKCNSGKEKRKESCVLLYRCVPVPSYLKVMEKATVRIRNVPSGKLPPLLMWSVTCLQPTTLDANLPAAIPLDLLQSLPLSSGMDGHSHVTHLPSPILFNSWASWKTLLHASSQGQPQCPGYDHPIFSFGFFFFVDLEQYFFIVSNFLCIKS